MHGRTIGTACWVLIGAAAVLGGTPSEEVLPNGIVLQKPWPPRRGEPTREPLAAPPYLTSPPAVIPIDLGRQLLVDDFLVEHTTLTRTYHRAQYHPASPVLRPDKPWEGTGRSARAGVFSDAPQPGIPPGADPGRVYRSTGARARTGDPPGHRKTISASEIMNQ